MKTKITWFAIAIILAANTFANDSNENKLKTQPTPVKESLAEKHFAKRSAQLGRKNIHSTIGGIFLDESSDLKYMPVKIQNYDWDSFQDYWVLDNQEVFSYDESERPVKIVREITRNNEFLTYEKLDYEWNKNGQIERKIISVWCPDQGIWIPELQEVYEYDKFDNLIAETHNQWSSQLNDWEAYYKYNINYTFTDFCEPLVIEAYYWSAFTGDMWFPSWRIELDYYRDQSLHSRTFSTPSVLSFEYDYREEYFYNDDKEISKMVIYSPTPKGWNPEYKITDIDWYNYEEKQLNSFVFWTYFGWSGHEDDKTPEWLKEYKAILEYHPELHSEVLYVEEFYCSWEERWFPFYRERTVFNEYLFNTGFYMEFFWDDWTTDIAITRDGEFDIDGQPLDIRTSLFDSWNGSTWENISRRTFEYKEIEIPTSSPVFNAPEELAKVFPNPAVNQISIASEIYGQELTVRIFNLAGQLLQSREFTAFSGQIQMDISSLPSGIYMVDLTSGTRKQVIKVMKK